MKHLSDSGLIGLCKTGSEPAFTALYERYRQTVINFAYQVLRDNDLTLDALQETFAYVFKKMPDYQPAAKFSTFLFTVTRHICINIAKKRRPGMMIPLDDVSHIVALKETNPQVDLLQAEELNNLVSGQLEQLPLLYREVIILKIIKGLQYDEISEIVKCPIGTVKSRLHNGLELLRTALTKIIKNTDSPEPNRQ